MNTCEREEKKNPLVPPFHFPPWIEESQLHINTQASALPLVAKSGRYTVETDRRRGRREAEKAVCRSPPFRNQIVY